MTQKAKTKLDKWDCIKLKLFLYAVKETEKLIYSMGKTFANYISDEINI